FLHHLNLIARWSGRLVVYGSSLHALGYACSAAAIAWKFYQTNHFSKHASKTLNLQLSGLFIEGVGIAKELQLLGPWQGIFDQARSIVIIAQSSFTLYMLSWPEKKHI
ncbi:MAG: hypothetical protein LW832_06265, partial [Parachlamydia sp.]|nr:hypothetical protein [Parachlamydia sp.]